MPFPTLTSTTEPPRPLPSLPTEVIDNLLLHVNRPTLLIIARSSRLLQSLAKPHMWRHLNLSITGVFYDGGGSPRADSEADSEYEMEAMAAGGLRDGSSESALASGSRPGSDFDADSLEGEELNEQAVVHQPKAENIKRLSSVISEADAEYGMGMSPAATSRASSPGLASDAGSISDSDADSLGEVGYSLQAMCLRQRAKTIIRLSNEDTLRHVRSLSYQPRPGTSRAAVTLLSLVSSTITSLDITPAYPSADYAEAMNKEREAEILDIRLVRSSLTLYDCGLVFFPALTHITLGMGAIYTADFLPVLCNWAPNLAYLAATIVQDLDRALPDTKSHLLSRPTGIRHLRIAFTFGYIDVVESDAFKSIFSVLTWSRDLKLLSVAFVPTEEPDSLAMEYIASAASRLAHLRDFSWRSPHPMELLNPESYPGTPVDVGDEAEEAVSSVCSVRRLIIQTGDFLLYVQHASLGPFFTDLEILHIDTRNDTELPLIHLPGVDVVKPELAGLIRLCPRLHSINLFRDLDHKPGHNTDLFPILEPIELSRNLTVEISSLCWGTSELLIVRILLGPINKDNYTEYRVAHRTKPKHEELHIMRVHEPGRAVPCRRQVFTEFDGRAVPLDVIEQMRGVEGASEEEWDKRGVRVGAEAWEVLLRWWELAKVDAIAPRGYVGAEADEYLGG